MSVAERLILSTYSTSTVQQVKVEQHFWCEIPAAGIINH